jgi:hypothetical protein
MMTRRMLLGSTAAAGAGAIAVTSFNVPAPVAAQTAGANPALDAEIQRQLKDGFTKLLGNEKAKGAQQMATTFRFYATTIDDDQVRAMFREGIRRKGRAAIILAPPIEHAEMERMGKALGIPSSQLPRHEAPDQIAREKALDLLLKEGLSPSLHRTADALEEMAVLLDATRRSRIQTVALMQATPGQCADVCSGAETQGQIAAAVCAFAGSVALVPGAGELAGAACAAAFASWSSFQAGCSLCKIAVSWGW